LRVNSGTGVTAALDQELQDMVDGGVGDVEAGLVQDRTELVLASQRKVGSKPLDFGA
jgi:hypothetical protein